MSARVAVVGAGSWGTAVATLATQRGPAVLWARRPELARAIEEEHRNPEYLPDHQLPAELRGSSDLVQVLAGAEVVVMAVPSHGFRAILEQAAPHISPGAPVVSLTKGLEQQTLARMTEVVAQVLPGHPEGVLTGPNLAGEVMAGHPTASVIAMADQALAVELPLLFSTETFRVYTNPDVVGCELAGALKNVMAIASGMADGMGFGDNTRAAVITRGLAELSRLGIALGADPLTLSGLAGLGDLAAPCTGRHA